MGEAVLPTRRRVQPRFKEKSQVRRDAAATETPDL